MPHLSKKRYTLTALALSDLLFFSFTDPNRLYMPLIAIGYILLGINLFIFVDYGLRLLTHLNLINIRIRWFKEGLFAVIYLITVMQSIGQLSFKAIISLIPLVLVAYFYFGYTSNRSQTD